MKIRPLVASFMTSITLAFFLVFFDFLRDAYVDGRIGSLTKHFDSGFMLTILVGGLAFYMLYISRIRSLSGWVMTVSVLWFFFCFCLIGVRMFVLNSHPEITPGMDGWGKLLIFATLNVYYLGSSMLVAVLGWFIMYRVFRPERAPAR